MGYNIHFKYRFEYCCIFFIDCYKSVYVRLNFKYNNTILIKHYKMKLLTVKWIIFYFFGYYVIFFFNIFGTTCKKCQKEWKNIFWPTCRVIVFNIPSTISAFIPKKKYVRKKVCKELSLCHKLKFSNRSIFPTWWWKPLIFPT